MNNVMMAPTVHEQMVVMTTAKPLPTAPVVQNTTRVSTMPTIVETTSPEVVQDSVPQVRSPHSPSTLAHTPGHGPVPAPTVDPTPAVMLQSCGVEMR